MPIGAATYNPDSATLLTVAEAAQALRASRSRIFELLASGELTGVEFKKFLEMIEVEVPAELSVHLICDNYATHKTPDIQRWLLRHPRFELHFTPTSGSWLNMVERWFGEFTTKKIKRGSHTSVVALEKDIRYWIETWNENPRPYVWTKPAEKTLASIARYCETNLQLSTLALGNR